MFLFQNQMGFPWMSNEHVLLLQAFLRQNVMIDSGSRLCNVWPVNCCVYLRLLSLVVKWPWHEADHWPPCSAENKNVWSCFSSPHVSCSIAQGQMYLLFYCCHAHLSLCAKWWGCVVEQAVIITELENCELFVPLSWCS